MTLPNPENCSLAELETAMKCAPTRQSFARIFAIRTILMGLGPDTVAASHAVSRRTVSNWIRKFNDQGIDGLIEKKKKGRPPKIGAEQSAQYRDLIDHPEKANQVHWTARKFHGYVRETLEHEVAYRTIVRWLHDNNYKLKVPQPWPDRQDEKLRQEWLKQIRVWLEDHGVDLWYLDEMGVEGDPRPRRRWIEKGKKGRVTKNGDHMRMNVTGAVCPRTGEFYALEFSHNDSEMFQVFLDHLNRDVNRPRRRNILICDNASWHKNKGLDWGDFEPAYLPPYSPDFNPIERLWLILKAEWFYDFVAKDRDALMARLDMALNWLIARKDQNRTTCAIKKTL